MFRPHNDIDGINSFNMSLVQVFNKDLDTIYANDKEKARFLSSLRLKYTKYTYNLLADIYWFNQNEKYNPNLIVLVIVI